jgi:hypothetical protein
MMSSDEQLLSDQAKKSEYLSGPVLSHGWRAGAKLISRWNGFGWLILKCLLNYGQGWGWDKPYAMNLTSL